MLADRRDRADCADGAAQLLGQSCGLGVAAREMLLILPQPEERLGPAAYPARRPIGLLALQLPEEGGEGSGGIAVHPEDATVEGDIVGAD